MTELSSPAIVNWVTINAHYEANVWEQTIDWNGLNKTSYTQSNVPENNQDFQLSTSSKLNWSSPIEGWTYEQELDLSGAWWNSTTKHTLTQRNWVQNVNLADGTWHQEHWASGVLIWKDDWSMSSTRWEWQTNPTMLIAKVAETQDSDYTMPAILMASALGMSIAACAYLKKRKTEQEIEEDSFHRI